MNLTTLYGHAVQLLVTPDIRYDPCGILSPSDIDNEFICISPWSDDSWMKKETDWESVQCPTYIKSDLIKGVLDLNEHHKNPKNKQTK